MFALTFLLFLFSFVNCSKKPKVHSAPTTYLSSRLGVDEPSPPPSPLTPTTAHFPLKFSRKRLFKTTSGLLSNKGSSTASSTRASNESLESKNDSTYTLFKGKPEIHAKARSKAYLKAHRKATSYLSLEPLMSEAEIDILEKNFPGLLPLKTGNKEKKYFDHKEAEERAFEYSSSDEDKDTQTEANVKEFFSSTEIGLIKEKILVPFVESVAASRGLDFMDENAFHESCKATCKLGSKFSLQRGFSDHTLTKKDDTYQRVFSFLEEIAVEWFEIEHLGARRKRTENFIERRLLKFLVFFKNEMIQKYKMCSYSGHMIPESMATSQARNEKDNDDEEPLKHGLFHIDEEYVTHTAHNETKSKTQIDDEKEDLSIKYSSNVNGDSECTLKAGDVVRVPLQKESSVNVVIDSSLNDIFVWAKLITTEGDSAKDKFGRKSKWRLSLRRQGRAKSKTSTEPKHPEIPVSLVEVKTRQVLLQFGTAFSNNSEPVQLIPRHLMLKGDQKEKKQDKLLAISFKEPSSGKTPQHPVVGEPAISDSQLLPAFFIPKSIEKTAFNVVVSPNFLKDTLQDTDNEAKKLTLKTDISLFYAKIGARALTFQRLSIPSRFAIPEGVLVRRDGGVEWLWPCLPSTHTLASLPRSQEFTSKLAARLKLDIPWLQGRNLAISNAPARPDDPPKPQPPEVLVKRKKEAEARQLLRKLTANEEADGFLCDIPLISSPTRPEKGNRQEKMYEKKEKIFEQEDDGEEFLPATCPNFSELSLLTNSLVDEDQGHLDHIGLLTEEAYGENSSYLQPNPPSPKNVSVKKERLTFNPLFRRERDITRQRSTAVYGRIFDGFDEAELALERTRLAREADEMGILKPRPALTSALLEEHCQSIERDELFKESDEKNEKLTKKNPASQ